MSHMAAEGEPVRVPRWKQREAIRPRSGRRRSAAEGRRMEDGGCVTGHPMLFDSMPAYEFDRIPEGGGYPEGFVEFAGRLMGCTDLADVVHLCSGSVRARYTFDLRPTSAAAVRCDVRELPIRSGSVRWVMVDPPYDREYAEELWSMGKQYPIPKVLCREVARILRPGGRMAFLHHLVPDLPPELTRIGTWGITTGLGYRIRALTIAERTGAQPFAVASAGADAYRGVP